MVTLVSWNSGWNWRMYSAPSLPGLFSKRTKSYRTQTIAPI